MSIAAGFMFNFTTGLLLVLISSLIAASITFLVARYIARDWIKEKFAKYMTAVDGEVEAHGFSNALGIRMIPGIPFIALNSRYDSYLSDLGECWQSTQRDSING